MNTVVVAPPISMSTTDAELRLLLTTARSTGGNDAIVGMLAGMDQEIQLRLLTILVNLDSHSAAQYVNYAGSVLDSGSSRHLSPHTCVTHSDDTMSLTGFNDTTAWTQGNGYLPLSLHDVRSDHKTDLDVYDADKMDGVSCPILSMGKMLRLGF